MNQGQLHRVNILELEQKCKSKKELYNFLSQDCQAFLPKQEATNIYFLKQIVRAQKDVRFTLELLATFQYLRRDQVKVAAVPHIEGLTVQDMLSFARNKNSVLRYLPDERDWVHLDRQWVSDLLYTIETEATQKMIEKALRDRKSRLEQSRDLVVQMRPEFVEALSRCLNFSTERGKAVNLLKSSSQRKRTLDEIEEVKEEEKALRTNKQQFLLEAKRLKMDQQNLQEQLSAMQREKEQLMQVMGSQDFGNGDSVYRME